MAANDVLLVAHQSRPWPGAVELFTAADGWLLAITRTPLPDAAKRLREEGYADSTMIIITDAAGVAPDRCGKIGDLLRYPPARNGRSPWVEAPPRARRPLLIMCSRISSHFFSTFSNFQNQGFSQKCLPSVS